MIHKETKWRNLGSIAGVEVIAVTNSLKTGRVTRCKVTLLETISQIEAKYFLDPSVALLYEGNIHKPLLKPSVAQVSAD
jgi:hypothetical protein